MIHNTEHYETTQHDGAVQHALDTMQATIRVAANDFDQDTKNAALTIHEQAARSLAALYRHKTTDYGTMHVACIMHGYDLTATPDELRNALAAYGLTYTRNGTTYLPTWSTHS